MGQRRRLRQRSVERRGWCADGGAQGAIQRVTGCEVWGGNVFTIAVVLALHHQLHAARAGTDQVHDLWVDHGRCNGHTDRQRKPHQHEAGELDGVAKLLHA